MNKLHEWSGVTASVAGKGIFLSLFMLSMFAVSSFANAQATDSVSWSMNPEGIRNAVNAKGYGIPSNSAFHYDNATASKVCQILGYNRVVSMDTKYPEKHARSGYRDGWYSPHDNRLSKWTGSSFETARANSMGNIWISSLTCADKIGSNPCHGGCPTPKPTATPCPTVTPKPNPCSGHCGTTPVSTWNSDWFQSSSYRWLDW